MYHSWFFGLTTFTHLMKYQKLSLESDSSARNVTFFYRHLDEIQKPNDRPPIPRYSSIASYL